MSGWVVRRHIIFNRPQNEPLTSCWVCINIGHVSPADLIPQGNKLGTFAEACHLLLARFVRARYCTRAYLHIQGDRDFNLQMQVTRQLSVERGASAWRLNENHPPLF